ncbi:MAG: hydrogenase iron-sulfur subunit [Anaerolineales bacterium]|nr:hydrogenase iron-sulfur subunit [Anaerolineales bacterium]
MEGDCHYRDGNINAKRRVKFVGRLLEKIGIDGRRIKMVNISSAMGGQFANLATEITGEIIKMGPNPLKKNVL